MIDPGFTEEQKQYLEGFIVGVVKKRANDAIVPQASGDHPLEPAAPGFSGPEAIHREAQDRFLSAGRKLSPEELAKRAKNPLDMWDELRTNASAGLFPKGSDIFLHKFQGLFYVAPAQNAFMCRLRIPGGILTAAQLRGLADVADRFAGGSADITTRANLQLRGIGPRCAPDVLTAIRDLGLTTRGAGADNVRNITGSPTAGIDPDELFDTRPLCRELHHAILNHRELYGLPRKFNVSFDGGGRVSALSNTNDIGFRAVAVAEGMQIPPGVYFRMALAGITGHGDYARDTGLLLEPGQCVPVAMAVIRSFIEHGDRTDRKKARLKYVVDRLGIDRFIEATSARLDFVLLRAPEGMAISSVEERKGAHIGFHPQRQKGFVYAGVAVPVGRLRSEQMAGLARIARSFGSGAIRLTVWQNLIVSDIPERKADEVQQALEAIGLDVRGAGIRGGIVACTGNTGCKFAATDTKEQALALVRHFERVLALDRPISVHLTGCPNSCAQHLIADIGLLGTKVERGEDVIEGYTVYVGGEAGTEKLGRELWRSVPFDELPRRLESLIRSYISQRRDSAESFRDFTERQSIDDLIGLCRTSV